MPKNLATISNEEDVVTKGYVDSLRAIFFSDGSDGSLTFDGSTTILGMTPSSSTYTLTRDIRATSITVNNGVTIITKGWKIFCSGTLTNNGTIKWDGNNASGTIAASALTLDAFSTIGGYMSASGWTMFAPTAGAGRTSAATGANAGASSTPPLTASNGGNGGSAGGNSGGTGSTFLTRSISSVAFTPFTFLQFKPITFGSSSPLVCAVNAGGAGGGGAGGGASCASGAGGTGGGVIVIYARTIDNTNGTISAKGGNGSDATTGVAGGGGGGGGGGLIFIVTTSFTGNTPTVSGGNGGKGVAGGSDGSAGSDGLVFTFLI